jgi:IS5 family transposase
MMGTNLQGTRLGQAREDPMLVTRNPSQTLWESILPPGYERLPAELERVDRLLDDEAFFTPYRAHFSPLFGRPSIPIETYLRMMYLKFRYRLGYESLCKEVADSISWSRFCRVPLGSAVPHPSTLEKITTRCGHEVIGQLNTALLAKARDNRVLRTDALRADTTVVEANVHYPTDSGLLIDAVHALTNLVRRVQKAGGAVRTGLRDRRRAAARRGREISASLKRWSGEAQEAVAAVTAELTKISAATIAEATEVVRNARRSIRARGELASGRLVALVSDLEVMLERSERVLAQARERLAGGMPESSSRLVSLHDPDARPIKKGRLGKPVEFGYKAQILDNIDGVVVDHSVHIGAVPDPGLLVPAVKRIVATLARAPRLVTADHIYGEARVEKELTELGVKRVVIPRLGKPGAERRAAEHKRSFRRYVKWRTGCEGRISVLKHRYGWDRSRLDGFEGTSTWLGLGTFAHNLDKISGLIAAAEHPPAPPAPPTAEPSAPGAATGRRARPARSSGPPRAAPPRPTAAA